jgi:transposase-like protein
MPITVTNPFKGRQYPGEVILQAVRWYLRYPLAYEHVADLLAERGLGVDASCVWRWVQVYSPELNKRCQPHLKRTNKNYRVDEFVCASASISIMLLCKIIEPSKSGPGWQKATVPFEVLGELSKASKR